MPLNLSNVSGFFNMDAQKAVNGRLPGDRGEEKEGDGGMEKRFMHRGGTGGGKGTHWW